jgi:hypothetical protein
MSEKKKRKQISNETKLDIVLNKNNLKREWYSVAQTKLTLAYKKLTFAYISNIGEKYSLSHISN